MDKKEYLLTLLQEECSEIIKDSCKAQRFGLDSDYAGETNQDLIIDELNDLMGVISLLEDNYILPSDWLDRNKIMSKKNKVEKFMKYSRETGRLYG